MFAGITKGKMCCIDGTLGMMLQCTKVISRSKGMSTGWAASVRPGMLLQRYVGHIMLLQCISCNCNIIYMQYTVYLAQYLKGSVVSHCCCFKLSTFYK